MTATVTVIGADGHDLPPGAGDALAAASLVVGGRAMLRRWVAAALGFGGGRQTAPERPKTIELPAPPELSGPALDALAKAVEAGEPAVVLAVGDPGYFGVLRALRERSLPTVYWPSVSYPQRIAAMIQRPWDDIAVVSVGARSFRQAVNVCRARSAVGVLTAPGAGPAELGAALRGWHRTLVVVDDIGGPGETLSIVDPAEAAARRWRDPSSVLCLADLDRVGAAGWLAGGEPVPPPDGWALDQDRFAYREGVGSGAEMRALALAKLAPRPGTLVWDVAAGCGALGIEAARLGAAVIAVENDAGLRLRIVTNAKRHGVDLRLVDGSLPTALTGLPGPDAVFLGTARADVVAACVAAGPSRIVVEVRELGGIGPVRDTLTDAGFAVDGRLLFSAPIEGLSGGGASVEQASSTLLLWGTRG